MGNADSVVSLKDFRITSRGAWTHDSKSWCLFLVQDGEGIMKEGANSHGLMPGDLAMLSAGIQASFKPSSKKVVAGNSLHFDPEKLSGPLSLGTRLMFHQAARTTRLVCVMPKTSALAQSMSDLTKTHLSCTLGRDPSSADLLPLVQPVVEEFRHALKTLQGNGGMAHQRILTVLDQLKPNELYDLSVDDLADRCGCSRRHLSRLIKDNCGCSLSEIRMQMRLDHAAAKLQHPESKVIDIAMDCGFGHLGSFSAKFRERFGTTPGDWRRRRQGANHNGTLLVRIHYSNKQPGQNGGQERLLAQ